MRIFWGFIIGSLLAMVAAMLAIASAGGGHGHYVLARILFPYSMLLTILQDNKITFPLFAFAIMQFPIYGVVIGYFWTRKRYAIVAATFILIGHMISAFCCFAGVIPNFS